MKGCLETREGKCQERCGEEFKKGHKLTTFKEWKKSLILSIIYRVHVYSRANDCIRYELGTWNIPRFVFSYQISRYFTRQDRYLIYIKIWQKVINVKIVRIHPWKFVLWFRILEYWNTSFCFWQVDSDTMLLSLDIILNTVCMAYLC